MLVWSGKEVRCHYSKSALNLRDDVKSERGGGELCSENME